MFSNTAYEALYQYIGLQLHGKFIEVITSHEILMAVVLMTFAFMFFTTTARFFSRYLPGNIVARKSVPLSKYLRLVVCLTVGLGLLSVGSQSRVKSYTGESWHKNPYVSSKVGRLEESFRVSFIFDLISSTAEEAAALLNRIVDSLFKKTHSQLEAPNFFYKAVLYAGSATISDPELRDAIDFYTEECIERILPLIGGKDGLDRLEGMFNDVNAVDSKLAGLKIDLPNRPGYTCLNAKNEVRQRLTSYAQSEAGMFPGVLNAHIGSEFDAEKFRNTQVANALIDHYVAGHEDLLGIQKGALLPEDRGQIAQYLRRIMSLDGLLSIVNFGDHETHGAALSSERAQEFNENLTRAPHVAGFIKMALIALFPWLVFPVVAGHWRILLYWFLAYLSVLLWAPIWTLLYHIVLNISLSSEAMAALGKLSDSISLYSAKVVVSKMHYMFAVYSWLQLLVGAAFSGAFIWMLRPLMSDAEPDMMPEFVSDAGKLAGSTSKIVGRL